MTGLTGLAGLTDLSGLLFANPDWLAASAAVVSASLVAVLFAFFHTRRRSRRLLGRSDAVESLRALSDGALLVALALLALALLGPRIGHKIVSVSTAGVDVVLLIDVSRSMLAQDVPPSRLHRALRAGEELLSRLEPGDRAALAAYSGRGVLLTPLTPDAAALRELLPALDIDLISPGGSNLRDGIEQALEAFDKASERARVLVVVSDGESSGRSADAGVSAAVRANVRVVSIALGSEVGTTIPDAGAPLLDEMRRVVVSRRRRAPLQNLADATGGQLFVADEWGAVDFDALALEVRRSVNQSAGPVDASDPSTASTAWVQERRTVPLVLPFAALAFVFLWLECARPTRLPRALRWPRLRAIRSRGSAASPVAASPPGRTTLAALALLCLLLVGAMSETERNAEADAVAWEVLSRVRPLEDSELLRLGVARARARRSEEAIHAFRAVALGASDPALAALAYHDLGVMALERGDLPDARNAFMDALALAPDDAQSRFNLEWTLRVLSGRSPQASPLKPSDSQPDTDEGGEPPTQSPDRSTDPTGSDDSTSPQNPEGSSGASDSPNSTPLTNSTALTDSSNSPGKQIESRDRAAAEAVPGGGDKTDPTQTATAPSLDASQREMWLQRIQDDPARALRSASRGGPGSRRRAGQTW